MPRENFLISGGSGDIGRAVCLRLNQAGYRPVVGYGHAQSAAEEVASECQGVALRLDLTDAACIEAAVERLTAEADGLAGVVLAASPPPTVGPFGQISE